MKIENIERILDNQLAKNKLSHAYLFYGKTGKQKFETALKLASNALLEDPRKSKNVLIINEESSTIKKQEVEKILEEFSLSTDAKYRFCIIKDADKLNLSSANSLLKFLEEPVQNAVIILITTKIDLIIDTVKSRSFMINFDYDNFESFKEELLKKTGDELLIKVLYQFSNNVSQAAGLLESEDFFKILELTKVTLNDKNRGLFYHYENQVLNKENIFLFIDLYTSALISSFKEEDSYFQVKVLENISDFSKRIELILDFKKKYQANVNFDITTDLLFNKFM